MDFLMVNMERTLLLNAINLLIIARIEINIKYEYKDVSQGIIFNNKKVCKCLLIVHATLVLITVK